MTGQPLDLDTIRADWATAQQTPPFQHAETERLGATMRCMDRHMPALLAEVNRLRTRQTAGRALITAVLDTHATGSVAADDALAAIRQHHTLTGADHD